MTNRDSATMTDSNELQIAKDLELDLTVRYGVMLSGDELRIVLGYSSLAAFRQGVSRKVIPVPVFTLKGRRGKFCLARDVATWLAAQRMAAKNAAGNPCNAAGTDNSARAEKEDPM